MHVEDLVTAQRSKQPIEKRTAAWLADLDDAMLDKLAAVGLISRQSSQQLGPFLDEYIVKRAALVKAGNIDADTLRIEMVTRDCLIDRFGPIKALRDSPRAMQLTSAIGC